MRGSRTWTLTAAAIGVSLTYASSVLAQGAEDPVPFELETADGVTVYGSLHGDPGAARALLLLFHQGGANADAEYGPLVPRLLAEGYAAITIDQRAGGAFLGGENRTAKDRSATPHYCEAYPDLEAALEFGRRRAQGRDIIVWGSSYSGALALRLAADHPDLAGVLAFSPAGGEAMGDCPAARFAPRVRIPTLALRPASELDLEHVRRAWEEWDDLGFEQYIAEPGVHGSSMLNEARVEGEVESTWAVVLSFLARVTGAP